MARKLQGTGSVRILVCGGRDFVDAEFFWTELWRILCSQSTKDFVVIQGGARGADKLAKEFANNNGIRCEEFPADWDKYGKAAGYIRNKDMLQTGAPDLVVAFPGGKGTANMVRLAREAGVEVKEITYSKESVEESTQG